MNKNIVAGLQAKGVNAIGLTGADMNVIRSVKRQMCIRDRSSAGHGKGLLSPVLP